MTNIYSVGIPGKPYVVVSWVLSLQSIIASISKLPSKVSNTESPRQVMVSPPIEISGAVSIVILSEADPVHPFSSVIVTEII